MPKVYVKRNGAVHTVFTDFDSGSPLPIRSYDDKPIGGFPQVFKSLRHLEREFPSADLIFIDKPRKEKAPAPQNQEARAKAKKLVAQMRQEQGLPPQPSLPPSELESKALNFYRMLKERGVYAADEHKLTLSIQEDVVADLIRELWPSTKEDLKSLDVKYG
jgi:hypothetical protein